MASASTRCSASRTRDDQASTGSEISCPPRATPKNPCPPPILLHRLVERGRRAVQRYPPFVGPPPGAFFPQRRPHAWTRPEIFGRIGACPRKNFLRILNASE